MSSATLYTIPAAQSFSDTLAEYIFEKYSLEDIPSIQLLLPTQRATLAMRDAFDAARESRGVTSLALPNMQAIGQVDEARLLRDIWSDVELRAEYQALPNVIEKPLAQLFLMRRIRYHWNAMIENEPNINAMPYGEAMALAQSLLQLYSDCANEMIPLDKVQAVNAEFDAQHWQLRADLLQHVTRDWMRYCAREDVALVEFRRAALVMLRAKTWERYGCGAPVIIAGSTGSLPATARLISTVSQMQKGCIILPEKEASDAENSAPSQQVFTHLLTHLRKRYEQIHIAPLGERFEEASLPVASCIIAGDIHEEAQLVAMMVREALEDKGQNICVVSDSAPFNRLLRAEAQGYGIIIDNPDGQRFSETAHGRFACLISQNIAQGYKDIDAFLALMLHPEFALNGEVIWREVARALDVHVLREMTLPPKDVSELLREASYEKKCAAYSEAIEALNRFITRADLRDAEAADMVQQFTQIYAVARGEDEPVNAQVSTLLEQLTQQMGAARITAAQWHEIWIGLCDIPRLRDGRETHPRVQLLSPQEARLQRFDTLILAQMNEGVWPKKAQRHAAWLAPSATQWLEIPESMEAHYALHDIACLMGQAKKVYCTRSEKEAGKTVSPSLLWNLLKAPENNGRYHQLLARMQQRTQQGCVSQKNAAAIPPKPSITAEQFPHKISPTAMQQLMQNPYGFYARYVLKLAPIQGVSESLAGAGFGNVMHTVMERYTHARNEDAGAVWGEKMMMRAAKKAGYDLGKYPAMDRLWWPRMVRGVEWWAQQDSLRRAQRWRVESEETVSKTVCVEGKEITIEGRIDRLESRENQSVLERVITDYKTGAIASGTKMALGVENQMPVLRVALGDESAALHYWQCDGAGLGGKVHERSDYDAKAPVDVEAAMCDVLRHYIGQAQPFYVTPIPAYAPRYDAFSHLARAADWKANVA